MAIPRTMLQNHWTTKKCFRIWNLYQTISNNEHNLNMPRIVEQIYIPFILINQFLKTEKHNMGFWGYLSNDHWLGRFAFRNKYLSTASSNFCPTVTFCQMSTLGFLNLGSFDMSFLSSFKHDTLSLFSASSWFSFSASDSELLLSSPASILLLRLSRFSLCRFQVGSQTQFFLLVF